ncbi:hypothetical protein K491DRAFT_718697 [Lophiostoma macrostomum CBS 122681]|uniref:Uncharacterized protein n=1 Tax=Lophiostoma macrostomum CBS 122681 TaxID=1314788 RepID=A0A6A6T2I8_9PLEO|nr:hypothetical protein K491DRAFT_718697 [Lophiostoma macrostomum CBS 122681]
MTNTNSQPRHNSNRKGSKDTPAHGNQESSHNKPRSSAKETRQKGRNHYPHTPGHPSYGNEYTYYSSQYPHYDFINPRPHHSTDSNAYQYSPNRKTPNGQPNNRPPPFQKARPWEHEQQRSNEQDANENNAIPRPTPFQKARPWEHEHQPSSQHDRPQGHATWPPASGPQRYSQYKPQPGCIPRPQPFANNTKLPGTQYWIPSSQPKSETQHTKHPHPHPPPNPPPQSQYPQDPQDPAYSTKPHPSHPAHAQPQP